jgi:hypothetical protein
VGTNADQIVMMVRNIKKSMIEYQDILWDIRYEKSWEEGQLTQVRYLNIFGFGLASLTSYMHISIQHLRRESSQTLQRTTSRQGFVSCADSN